MGFDDDNNKKYPQVRDPNASLILAAEKILIRKFKEFLKINLKVFIKEKRTGLSSLDVYFLRSRILTGSIQVSASSIGPSGKSISIATNSQRSNR